jgi:hypothetical protein
VAVALAAHAGDKAGFGQRGAEVAAGILEAAIAVLEQPGGRTAMAQGHGQGAQDQLGGEARARRPADDPAAVEIEEGGHVEPAFSGART